MSSKKLTYGEAIAELEQLLAQLRTDELSIDTLAGSVRRANELIAHCRKMLAKTEAEVEKLINSEA